MPVVRHRAKLAFNDRSRHRGYRCTSSDSPRRRFADPWWELLCECRLNGPQLLSRRASQAGEADGLRRLSNRSFAGRRSSRSGEDLERELWRAAFPGLPRMLSALFFSPLRHDERSHADAIAVDLRGAAIDDTEASSSPGYVTEPYPHVVFARRGLIEMNAEGISNRSPLGCVR